MGKNKMTERNKKRIILINETFWIFIDFFARVFKIVLPFCIFGIMFKYMNSWYDITIWLMICTGYAIKEIMLCWK